MCTASSFSCHESLADSVDPASLLVVFEWCLKINSHWKKCPLQHMLQLLLYIMYSVCWISTLTCLYIDVNIPNYLKKNFLEISQDSQKASHGNTVVTFLQTATAFLYLSAIMIVAFSLPASCDIHFTAIYCNWTLYTTFYKFSCCEMHHC